MFTFRLPKKFKIKTFFKEDIEPEEIFLDSLAKKREEDFGISEKKFETPLSFKISILLWLLIVFIIFVFSGISFYFQILENEKYVALAQRNKFVILSIKAARGVIYDQFNNQLVFNNPSYDLTAKYIFFSLKEEKKEYILSEISKITKENFHDLKERLKENNNTIIKNIEHNSLIALKSRIDEFPELEIEETFIREYKYGELLSHIIGYTGKINKDELALFPNYNFLDYIGKSGIEKWYENFLKRNSGSIRVEKDALGNQISKEIIALPETGESLVLWLDLELQKKIKESLDENLERLGAKKAVAIALNPKTGGVLAMVNIPSYDNNIFNFPEEKKEEIKKVLEEKDNPLFNRAISGQYPTGSVIKPFVALGALEEKIITPEKQIYAGGKIEIPHRYDPSIVYIFGDLRVHGLTDMRKAIAASVNVYFYTIGGGYRDQKGLGPTNIKKYLELFGWGKKTGIDLPEEKDGLIPSPEWKRETKKEAWLDGDTYNLSIGQGNMFITPIQVAMSYSVIANGGTLYEPKIVKKIIYSSGEEKEIEKEVIRENFLDPKNIKVIQEGMRATVTGENSPYASAMSLNLLSKKVAAKTGTAQISRQGHFNNWIGVYGPYEDPEIVLLILIEEVKGVQPATIPVAREVLEWYFENRQKEI